MVARRHLPGVVRTPLVEQQMAPSPSATGSPRRRRDGHVARAQAIGRLIEPADVADVAAFCSGPVAFTVHRSHSTTVDGALTSRRVRLNP